MTDKPYTSGSRQATDRPAVAPSPGGQGARHLQMVPGTADDLRAGDGVASEPRHGKGSLDAAAAPSYRSEDHARDLARRMAATPTPEPPVGAIRSGIEASVWRAVDNGTADIYMGVDFSSLPDGELVLIAARACAELERNANDYRDGAA